MKRGYNVKILLCIILFFSMCLNVSAVDSTPAPIANVTLEVENSDLIAIMPDKNFRIAVVEAIKDDGMDTGASVRQILESYTGDINAQNKGIENIQGLEYLKNANSINLKKNKIKDFTPVAKAVDYYGETDFDVSWNLGGNSFEKIPDNFGGRLVIEQAASTSYTYPLNPATDIHSFIRTSVSQRFDVTLNVGKCILEGSSLGNDYVRDGFARIVALNVIKKTDDPDIGSSVYPLDLPVEVLDASQTPDNTKNKYVKISDILLNEELMLGIGIDEILRYWTTDENGTLTPGSQSFKYYVSPKIVVYDKVKLVHSDLGSASLVKTAKDTGKPLMNAEYAFYQGETLLKSGLKTDEDGQVVVRGLAAGDYYFKETKAPEGYLINETPISVRIKDPENAHGTITGGEGQSVIDSDGTTVTAGSDELFIAGKGSTDLSLTVTGNGEFSIIVDYSALARSDGERGPHGEVDERPYTRIFSTMEDAEKDINDMKNANRVAGPITISVQYAPNTTVHQTNDPIPVTPDPEEPTPENPTPENPTPETPTPEKPIPETPTPDTSTTEITSESKKSPATGIKPSQNGIWYGLGSFAMVLTGYISFKKRKKV